jgi:hypothetical protein
MQGRILRVFFGTVYIAKQTRFSMTNAVNTRNSPLIFRKTEAFGCTCFSYSQAGQTGLNEQFYAIFDVSSPL